MLLDDSIELDYSDTTVSAEPLLVNWDFDLSKVWIPSSVLPNRKRQRNPNENKPFILHTLERPDYSQTFSIYSDECPQYHESQTSSAVPSGFSHYKVVAGHNNELPVVQQDSSSQHAVEWDVKLDTSSENVISPKHALSNKPDYSLTDSPETYNSMIRHSTQWEKKALNTYSIEEDKCSASSEDLTRRMAEILSEDEPPKEDWRHEDVVQINQISTGSTLESIPPSTKDSLEELYYSDDDENQFAEEYEPANLEIESPEKNHKFSIYTDNSFAQEQTAVSFVNNLEQAKDSSEKLVSQFHDEAENVQSKNHKELISSVFNQSGLNVMDDVIDIKGSKHELFNSEENTEDPIEKVPELPIAYKRPPLLVETTKTKPQKEKKKTKRSKINIPLTELFQSPEKDRFKAPERDEFLENLIRQGKCAPLNQETNINELSSVKVTKGDIDEFPSINLPDRSKDLFWESALEFRQGLCSEPQLGAPNETIRNEGEAKSILESTDPLDTLVIDNIPLDVSKENLESFILGYGELKNLTLKRNKKFQTAKLQMNFTEEVDWIIECLNGTQPFGSSDNVLIKCYRLR